jgi:cytochrome b561
MTVVKSPTYDPVARGLHWIVASLIAAQFLVGWTMPDILRDTPPTGLVGWHLSLGATIVLFVALRVLWRITHRAPPLPSSTPQPLRFVATATHWLMYALLIVVPVLGWGNAASRGYPVRLFGVVSLPPVTAQGSSIGHAMGDIHSLLATVLAIVIGLHIVGALFHRFILRDNTLSRMLPGA